MNALNASNSPTADDKKGGFHEESDLMEWTHPGSRGKR
jgi:hypothetical protein